MGRASRRKKARRLSGHAAGRARTLRSTAGAPQWPDGSLGGRFFGVREVAQAQAASAVGRLDLMATAVDPVQWPVAVSALIRAVVFDGLQPDHPDVSAVLDVLAPVAEDELGNTLETLVHGGGVPQHEVLRVGLVVLSTLADLCRSDSASILRPAA